MDTYKILTGIINVTTACNKMFYNKNKRNLVLHIQNMFNIGDFLQFLYVGFITSEQVHSLVTGNCFLTC